MPVAIAGFTPTNRKPASDYSRSAGKRGCPNESTQDIPLTLLAPQSTVGYTTSLRPTFVGFISSPQKVEFRIFEFSLDNTVTQIGDAIIKDIQPGVFQISLPEQYPNLIVGKKYLWQLAISCSGVQKVEAAEFMIVEISSKIKTELSTISDAFKKSNIYAEEGLWYEALTEALKLANYKKLGNLGSNLIQDLAKYESPRARDKEELFKKRIKYLQTIAIQEQL
ncbi:DUF928 domain-containing protein [Nostoc sp. FACHB-280]|uniref:DUF928 domain-containing protein n=1 Tax=Nostoc sp. FACHB-280 TaxID=2692839 RepID=UPI001F557A6B|nr:DUF928 domain-containing protein [Nostoc sp. FACHB-280]